MVHLKGRSSQHNGSASDAANGSAPGAGRGAVATDPGQNGNGSIDRRELRSVLGRFATGITVVTTGVEDPHGMTANAFTSVSLVPPLVLVCVGREAVMHETLISTQSFAVSVLGGNQEPLARHFANRLRPRGRVQFEVADWVPGRNTGAPLLVGALAWLECSLMSVYEGGDHSIFLGEVLDIARSSDQDALLFFGGAYHRLTWDRPATEESR